MVMIKQHKVFGNLIGKKLKKLQDDPITEFKYIGLWLFELNSKIKKELNEGLPIYSLHGEAFSTKISHGFIEGNYKHLSEDLNIISAYMYANTFMKVCNSKFYESPNYCELLKLCLSTVTMKLVGVETMDEVKNNEEILDQLVKHRTFFLRLMNTAELKMIELATSDNFSIATFVNFIHQVNGYIENYITNNKLIRSSEIDEFKIKLEEFLLHVVLSYDGSKK